MAGEGGIAGLYAALRTAITHDGPYAVICKRKMAPGITGVEGSNHGAVTSAVIPVHFPAPSQGMPYDCAQRVHAFGFSRMLIGALSSMSVRFASSGHDAVAPKLAIPYFEKRGNTAAAEYLRGLTKSSDSCKDRDAVFNRHAHL